MRKSLLLIPTILLLAACSDSLGLEDERKPNIPIVERCDPPRFEAGGECFSRRGPKPTPEEEKPAL